MSMPIVALNELVPEDRPICYGVLKPGPYVSDGVPLVRITDLKDGRVAENLHKVSRDLDEEFRRSRLRGGELLISIQGTIGEVVIAPPAISGANISRTIARVALIDRADAGYVRHWLLSPPGQRAMTGVTVGTTRASLNIGTLRKVQIPLPPLAEQRRIAAILDKADAIRRKHAQATRVAGELLRGVFLDLFGDPVVNERGWPARQLIDVAEIGSGIMKGRDFGSHDVVDLPYLRVANVQDGYLDLDEIKTITVRSDEIEKYRLMAGDVLMTEGGDYDKLGRGAIWRAQIPDCVHQNHIYRIRPRAGVLVPEYLSALGGSQYGKRYFMSCAKQTTGIATINKTQLGRFPVLLPPLELQRKYARLVQQQEAALERVASAAASADSLHSSIQRIMFNGGG